MTSVVKKEVFRLAVALCVTGIIMLAMLLGLMSQAGPHSLVVNVCVMAMPIAIVVDLIFLGFVVSALRLEKQKEMNGNVVSPVKSAPNHAAEPASPSRGGSS